MKDVDEVSEMKRVGAALLAVAPSSTRNDAIFPARRAEGEPRESSADRGALGVEDREVPREPTGCSAPGVMAPSRLSYKLYKVDRATAHWEEVRARM